MKKRYLLIVIFFLVSIVLISIFVFNKTEKNYPKKIVKIGAILPLTGEYAVYGQNDKKGIDLALSKVDTNLFNIKVIYEDNKGTAKDAVTAINKLKSEDVFAIIDDAISSITLATVPISDKNKIVHISTGASNPKLSGISKYFFRVWNSDIEEGKFAAVVTKDTFKYNTVTILYLNTDYGVGLMEAYKSEYEKRGGIVNSIISFDEKERDYKNIINKINYVKSEMIYLIGYAPQTGIIVKQLREQNKKTPILSTVATEDKKFIELAGKFANGTKYIYNPSVSNSTYKIFKESYSKKYEEEPPILTDVGYDVMHLLLKAIENNVKESDSLAKFLHSMPEFDGASGKIKFDANGDVHKPMIIKTIENNMFVKFHN